LEDFRFSETIEIGVSGTNKEKGKKKLMSSYWSEEE